MKRHISILLSFLFLFLFNISFALTEKDFKHSMNFYQKLVEKKVSVEELIFTLQKILQKYGDIEVNLTPVREKLLILRKFRISRDFYERLEQKGATIDERVAALKRILIKFGSADADLSGMEKRLRELQRLRAGEEEELEEFEEFEVEKGTVAATIEGGFEEGEISDREIEEETEDLEEFKEFKP